MPDFPTLFQAFSQLKVLIVGDVMVDAYVWGKVERISPEAPVPVVRVQRRENRLGGAANVALNVLAMGATPLLCSVIGQDTYGNIFQQLLQKHQITTDHTVTSPERTTTVKERVIAGSQHIVRVDAEDDHLLTETEQQALLAAIAPAIKQADVVIFQDYDKGVIDQELIRQVIRQAQQRGIPVAIDPKKRNFLSYQQATLFKPNLKELKIGLQQEKIALHAENYAPLYDEQQAIAESSEVLRKRLHHQITLITLSEKGVFVDDQAQGHHFIPAHVRQIADVSGAGDTLISIAALCLALKVASPTMAALANLAGGIVCEYTGVVPIPPERLLQEAQEYLNIKA